MIEIQVQLVGFETSKTLRTVAVNHTQLPFNSVFYQQNQHLTSSGTWSFQVEINCLDVVQDSDPCFCTRLTLLPVVEDAPLSANLNSSASIAFFLISTNLDAILSFTRPAKIWNEESEMRFPAKKE